MTRKLKFLLAYDGTHFVGWQRQKNSRSVQGVLEAALKQLAGKPVAVTGAGRTDSGVHAEGQVAHAAVTSRLSLPEIQKALNAILPSDVVVRSVEIAPDRFHARYSAKSKWYRYQIWNDPVRPLSGRERMVHLAERLNLPAMRRAARPLTGRRDFKRFASSGRGAPAPRHFLGSKDGTASVSSSPVRSTVRTLRLEITRKGPLVTLDFRANGFLYHMARRITGYLIEIGKGKPAPAIPPTAPARGLCLIEVRY